MENGKVLKLYITMPDMMRSGHRMEVEDFDCDPGGIIGDLNHEQAPDEKVMLLVSKKSYDLIDEADLFVDPGALLENIFVDIDLNHLKVDSIIEVGDVIMQVTGPCEAYGYLYGFDPELPEIIKGNRGIFVRPVEDGRVAVGDEVKVLEEA